MDPHRSLAIGRFHTAVGQDLLTEYLIRRGFPEPEAAQAGFNLQALEHLLDTAPPELAAIIEEEFHRINDVCETSYGVLARAFERKGIPIDPDRPPEEHATWLFLHDPAEFDFAYSHYLLVAGGANLNVYSLAVEQIDLQGPSTKQFSTDVEAHLKEEGKGIGHVHGYYDRGETVLLIKHGTGQRAVNLWEEEGVPLFTRLRFAEEDVLIYEHATRLLRMKTSHQPDRDEYLRLFAKHFAGDEELASRARQEEMFSLLPVQEEKFDYSGRGEVLRVTLAQVNMRVWGKEGTQIIVRANDARQAFAVDLGSLSFASGIITRARFRFDLHRAGRRKTQVTVEVAPPAGIRNLKERWYRQLILDYLQEQGVKLR